LYKAPKREYVERTYPKTEKTALEQKLSYYEIPLEFNNAIKADEDPIVVDNFRRQQSISSFRQNCIKKNWRGKKCFWCKYLF
jgi:hypothetical protein